MDSVFLLSLWDLARACRDRSEMRRTARELLRDHGIKIQSTRRRKRYEP
jgi:hypothetical protein